MCIMRHLLFVPKLIGNVALDLLFGKEDIFEHQPVTVTKRRVEPQPYDPYSF